MLSFRRATRRTTMVRAASSIAYAIRRSRTRRRQDGLPARATEPAGRGRRASNVAVEQPDRAATLAFDGRRHAVSDTRRSRAWLGVLVSGLPIHAGIEDPRLAPGLPPRRLVGTGPCLGSVYPAIAAGGRRGPPRR